VPAIVAGFEVPGQRALPPGHTWALAEAGLVRVGIDDFAAKLTGGVTSIDIPERGQWIRQDSASSRCITATVRSTSYRRSKARSST
jgi:glycine cleavage system H lipoate-binding protein